jgi:hypothetical protein
VLEQRPKGDPEKVNIAQRMRCETTMTLAWIAKRLGMGTKTHLAHLLYWSKRDKTKWEGELSILRTDTFLDVARDSNLICPNGATSFSPAVARNELPWVNQSKIIIINPNGVAALQIVNRTKAGRVMAIAAFAGGEQCE